MLYEVITPQSLTEMFDQALAGDAALRDFLDGTENADQKSLEQQRNPPHLKESCFSKTGKAGICFAVCGQPEGNCCAKKIAKSG